MTINASSIAAPTKLNFVAATPTAAEKTLAGLLSSTFIADAAKVVRSSFAAQVKTDLTHLKEALLSGESSMQLAAAISTDFGALAEAGVRSPYNKTAGKALAAMFTTARTNALYGLLPPTSLTKTEFNADIAKLKTGLATGHGFAELFKIL